MTPLAAPREQLTFTIGGDTYVLGADFAHPGGAQVLREHAGQDITEVFEGGAGGHAHSEAAWALLQSFKLRDPAASPDSVLAAGAAAAAEDGTHVTAAAPALDESKPLLQQVWRLGPEAYEAWVHRPVAGQPRFFRSEWAERVTKVQWWVVPLLWLPLVAYAFRQALGAALPAAGAAAAFSAGVLAWGLVEYCIHRLIFHAKPRSGWAIFLHFLFHGCHHKYPMDVERLVFPPIPASWVVYFFYRLLHAALPKGPALAVFAGMLGGYVLYDCMHYFQHSGLIGGRLKAAHMHHHYVDSDVNYGISSPLFDILLGTFLAGAGGQRRGSRREGTGGDGKPTAGPGGAAGKKRS